MKKALYILFFIISSYQLSSAQLCDTADVLADPCLICDIKLDKSPCVSTLDTIGCIPFQVNAIDCSGACKPRYIYEGGASNRTLDSFYVYETAGVYNIIQQIGTLTIESDTFKHIRAVSDDAPLFRINYCKDYIVTLSFDPSNLYDKYIINYGDGSALDTVLASSSPQKQYIDATVRNVNVKGIYNYAPCTNSSTIQVSPQKDLILPALEQLKTTSLDENTGQLQLTMSGSSFFPFSIQIGTSSQTLSPIDSFSIVGNDTLILIDNLNTIDSSYCLNVTTYDVCGNSIASDTFCSLSIFATPLNNQNNLTWTPYSIKSNFSNYQLIKNQDTTVFSSIEETFVDTAVICANDYCYTVKVTPSSPSGLSIISNTNCIQSFSDDTPAPIHSFYSSFNSNEAVGLSWLSPSPFIVEKSTIQKSLTPNEYSSLATVDNFKLSYVDNSALPTNTCYIINYIDACQNASNSLLADTTCPIILTAIKIHDSKYELSWSSYKGHQLSSYWIEYLDSLNNVAFSVNMNSLLSYIDTQPFDEFQHLKYRIRASASNEPNSYSNIVSFELKSQIVIPNAFSPNGDGLNDTFIPDSRFIKSFSLKIYNRWGELLFEETNSLSGWDGTYLNNLVPSGSYTYLLEGIDYSENKLTKKGIVTVVY